MKLFSMLILLIFSTITQANTGLPNHRHITIKGTANIAAIPDLVVVTFEVSSIKSKALNAKKDVDRKVNKLLGGLDQFNVSDDEVSASNLLTEPHITYTDEDTEVFSGYLATRTLKVTLTDIAKMNHFIDFALSVEINEIENIQLFSSKAQALEEQVNKMAIKNAINKATSLAKAFGAELGKIYSINASSNRSHYGYESRMERIEVTGSRIDKPGRYLQAKINFTSAINVVFDLDVE